MNNSTVLTTTSTTTNSTQGSGPQDWFFDISQGERIFTAVFLSLVAVVTIVGNSIALHAFIVSPELKRNTYYFIASLSVSDLMIAVLSIPNWIAQIFNSSSFPAEMMVFHSNLDIFCGTLSIMSLAMIGIERFVCIKYALHYHRIVTTRRVKYMIMLIIVYAAICTAVNYLTGMYPQQSYTDLYNTLQGLIITMAFIIPVALKLFSYGNIYQEAKKQSAEIQKHERLNFVHDNDDTNTTSDHFSSSEFNDDDSAVVKPSHSNSRVSWTTSPLARRKYETTKRNDSTRSESPRDDYHAGEYNDGEESKALLKDKIKGLIRESSSCFRGKDHQLDCNENPQYTSIDTINNSTNDRKISLQRQDTDTSIKSILKKKSMEEDCYLMTMSNIEEEKPPSQVENGKKKKKAKSVQEKHPFITRKNTDEEERDRSRSCPYSVPPGKSTRKSLEVNGFPDTKELEKARKGSSSPFIKRFRSSSKWSPANSPSVNRKSQSKQKRQEQKIKRFKKEMRAAKVVGLIMGTFLFCWTPFIIFIFLNILEEWLGMRALMIAIDLHYLNSAINPILYVLLNRVYRNAVLKAINKIKRHFNCIQ